MNISILGLQKNIKHIYIQSGKLNLYVSRKISPDIPRIKKELEELKIMFNFVLEKL